MPNIFPFIQTEILREELAQLLFLSERHLRWARETEDRELQQYHRSASDVLKETAKIIDEKLVPALLGNNE